MAMHVEFQTAIRPEVAAQASAAYCKYANSAVGPATYQKYLAAWGKFKQWLLPGVNPFDSASVNGDTVALYFAYLIESCAADNVGPQRVKEASAAISHFFSVANLPSPTELPACSRLYKAAEHILITGSKLDRAPLTPADVRKVLEFHLTGSCSLRTRMHLTIFLLMFVGLLRVSDAQNILVHDDFLRFIPAAGSAEASGLEGRTAAGVLIYISHSKTDQAWHGKWIAIGATGGQFCPVRLLQTLLHAGCYVRAHATEDCGPLLRQVTRSQARHGEALKQITSPMHTPIAPLGAAAFRASIRAFAAMAGLDKQFNLHSLRIGGTTTAALDPSIPAETIRQLGRWKSSNTMEGHYIRTLEVQVRGMFTITAKIWPF